MPRASYYRTNKEKLLRQQKERRERIKKALLELERLEKLEQQKLDLDTFETVEVKRIIKRQIREDNSEPEIEGANIW